jgi:mRNA-degrading endonuclease YafQ of YafQ-DinJ toxin-antitoxin module
MLSVEYTSEFIRIWKKLPSATQSEVKECIELFKDPINHSRLQVHPLKGKYKGWWSFSVDFSTRIIFMYAPKDKSTVYLAKIGDHSVYK